MLIIDCHGHYTTAPEPHQKFRDAQLVRIKDSTLAAPVPQRVSDDEIRETIETNQLRLQRERGADSRCFRRAPRRWAITSATRRSRSRGREPATISSSASSTCIPRTSSASASCRSRPAFRSRIRSHELERCVNELGFVGCNLNPDPSGGHWTAPPLTDRHWYPFYEKMVELDVPAMIHVSASCNPNFHATGAHYINADTTAFMQFIQGDLFRDFPTLRFIIPHGGGAVPYHWGRYRGLADMLKRPPLDGHVMRNVYLRHLRVPPAGHRPARRRSSTSTTSCSARRWSARCAASIRRPAIYFDDTKRYIDALDISAADEAPDLRAECAPRLSAARRAA